MIASRFEGGPAPTAHAQRGTALTALQTEQGIRRQTSASVSESCCKAGKKLFRNKSAFVQHQDVPTILIPGKLKLSFVEKKLANQPAARDIEHNTQTLHTRYASSQEEPRNDKAPTLGGHTNGGLYPPP